ncbi:Rieske 2Fe-2S domain-containing protein [Brasilonema bromeliae]|uniref:Aromatic ring-hydroxylating dioxygenase subunit alpha n=1 Tax=Brasilonema bromeliae SPC951 TaxID=385972 RepID=A0ABX1P8M9_9CYAN|nr:Rieske 2Fe-2S domain-containing protein [Brasilonema bromeliae]NMG20789.1 aromatic ring-hydroxylating dioxygenase subunit alpha [Brasilonema bromeliae SPC951]
MIVDSKIEEQARQTALQIEQNQEFNWRECWYPVCFVQDLPKNRSYSFSLYDEPFVLFRDLDGKLVCLVDRCPHRAAKLSDGQITDGKIECLYHGWQFGSDGQCLHIPQLATDAKIPANACVQSFKIVERQGMVWMWAGVGEAAADDDIPTIEELDKPEFVTTDVMRDLPYDQFYFIENIMDPAHVHISHDGTLGQRENAKPSEMEVLENSSRGIRGRLRGMSKPNLPWSQLDFIAPNFVIYKFSVPQRGVAGGVAFYSIPLGKGRCRILVRNYNNFKTWKFKLTPRWLDHMLRNRVLEEDLPLIIGQKTQIERLGQSLKQVFLPLKTCDTFVVEYYKWLDKFGSSLPYYQGYSTSKNIDNEGNCLNPPSLDRFSQHTQLCSSCSGAYQVTNRVKQISVGVAIALAALAISANGWMQILAVSASLGAVGIAVAAQKLKTHFERPYTRH